MILHFPKVVVEFQDVAWSLLKSKDIELVILASILVVVGKEPDQTFEVFVRVQLAFQTDLNSLPIKNFLTF